eukprot:521000_1
MQSNASDWSVEKVIGFLHNIGVTEYDKPFTSNHINGHALLLLSSDELRHDLGIQSLGHRKCILGHIEKLQNNNGTAKDNANEYAMTACISAAVSSILTQHYQSNGTVHPLQLLKQTDHECEDKDDDQNPMSDMNHRNSIVRVAVCMATEAARYIIQNQERIMNIIHAHPSNSENHNILDTLTNCRKLFAFNGHDADTDTNNNNNNNMLHFKTTRSNTPTKGSINHEPKRSNRAWSDCDERELIKLKSLGTLTWNRVGECLQRTGAACQLHWKTMKNMNSIETHIQYIKTHSNNNDKNYRNKAISMATYEMQRNHDMDTTLVIEIDKVLQAHQWRLQMLDVLWGNVEKEMEQKKEMSEENNHCNLNDNNHCKMKKSKKEKKKKKKRKHKHKHKHKEYVMNGNGYTHAIQPLMEDRDSKHHKSRSNSRWTNEEEEILIQMLEQTKTLPEISTKLGRSIPAINQHRLAMKQKNAKSLNDSSEDENSGDGYSNEDDDDRRRQQSKSNVVLTPIITPNSYVSQSAMIQMPPQFNMGPSPSDAYSNGVYPDAANMSNATTTTTSSAHSSNPIQSNPFKSMPMFNVHRKRSLSPSYVDSAHTSPPNKKARLSITDHTTSLCRGNIVLPSLNTFQ